VPPVWLGASPRGWADPPAASAILPTSTPRTLPWDGGSDHPSLHAPSPKGCSTPAQARPTSVEPNKPPPATGRCVSSFYFRKGLCFPKENGGLSLPQPHLRWPQPPEGQRGGPLTAGPALHGAVWPGGPPGSPSLGTQLSLLLSGAVPIAGGAPASLAERRSHSARRPATARLAAPGETGVGSTGRTGPSASPATAGDPRRPGVPSLHRQLVQHGDGGNVLRGHP